MKKKMEKDIQEYTSFEVFICGKQIELYSMIFNSAKGYHVYLLETIALVTFNDIYTCLEETIEFQSKKKLSM
jgi:hypothetical protein